MLWGAGTAIGEIPPYWMSYSAAQAGQKTRALQEIEEVGFVTHTHTHTYPHTRRMHTSAVAVVHGLIPTSMYPRTRVRVVAVSVLYLQKLQSGAKTNVIERILARMETWMMHFIKNHGFWGILLLASW